MKFFAFAALVLGFFAGSALGADPMRRSLVHGDSLIGWEHGEKSPIGWTADGQMLVGGISSQPLVSGWTFGDFELRFQWQTQLTGVLEVQLLDVPRGDGLIISLREGEGCAAVTDEGQELAAGKNLPKSENAWHETTIRRSGDMLEVEVAGKPLASVKVAAERRFGLALNVPRGVASLRDLTVSEPRGEAIFNGQDKAGWAPIKDEKRQWAIEHGELVAPGRGGHYFRTEAFHGNYTLSLAYKIKPGGNSGIGLRVPKNGWPSVDGIELQILAKPGKDKGSHLSIYQQQPPLARADRSDDWNEVVVKFDGRMVTAWENGVLVQHANLRKHLKLTNLPLEGWLGFQDHGAKIRFRDVDLLTAPSGEGPEVWNLPSDAR